MRGELGGAVATFDCAPGRCTRIAERQWVRQFAKYIIHIVW
jgi:hypothetical protein